MEWWIMGLFDKKEKTEKICVNCGGIVEIFGSTEIADGWLCRDCCKKCGYDTKMFTKKKTLTDVRKDTEAILTKELELQKLKAEADKKEAVLQELLNSFKPTKKVLDYLAIDEHKKQWIAGKIKRDSKVYSFEQLADYELIDLGSTKECSMLRIKISISNADISSVDVKFLESGAFSPTHKRDSFVYRTNYKFAQECMSLLHLMSNSNRELDMSNTSKISAADEILKFKNLLDSGIITQEEFDSKKKQLLGL